MNYRPVYSWRIFSLKRCKSVYFMQGHHTQIDNGFPHNIFKNQIDFCKTTSRDCLDYSLRTQVSNFYFRFLLQRQKCSSESFICNTRFTRLFLTMGTIGFIRFIGFKYKNSAYLHMLYVNNISIKRGEEKLYLIHQHHSSTLLSRWST